MNLDLPKQTMPYTRFQKIADGICLGVIAGMFLFVWSQLSLVPDMVPTHFNWKGNADGYGGKDSLFILPGSAVFAFFCSSLSRIDPRYINLPVRLHAKNARPVFEIAYRMISWIQICVVIGFAIFLWQTIEAAKASSGQISMFPLWTFLILLFAIMGSYVVKIRRVAKSIPAD